MITDICLFYCHVPLNKYQEGAKQYESRYLSYRYSFTTNLQLLHNIETRLIFYAFCRKTLRYMKLLMILLVDFFNLINSFKNLDLFLNCPKWYHPLYLSCATVGINSN